MKEIKSAILMFIVFTVICGGLYPAVVTGIATIVFPKQAGGSFITDKSGKVVGSSLSASRFPNRNTSGRALPQLPTSAITRQLPGDPIPDRLAPPI